MGWLEDAGDGACIARRLEQALQHGVVDRREVGTAAHQDADDGGTSDRRAISATAGP